MTDEPRTEPTIRDVVDRLDRMSDLLEQLLFASFKGGDATVTGHKAHDRLADIDKARTLAAKLHCEDVERARRRAERKRR